MKERRYPKINESTKAHLEIYGWAETGKNYYELKTMINAEGEIKTVLEWTNTHNGDAWSWDYKE